MLVCCVECKKPIFVSSAAFAKGDVELNCGACNAQMSVKSSGVVALQELGADSSGSAGPLKSSQKSAVLREQANSERAQDLVSPDFGQADEALGARLVVSSPMRIDGPEKAVLESQSFSTRGDMEREDEGIRVRQVSASVEGEALELSRHLKSAPEALGASSEESSDSAVTAENTSLESPLPASSQEGGLDVELSQLGVEMSVARGRPTILQTLEYANPTQGSSEPARVVSEGREKSSSVQTAHEKYSDIGAELDSQATQHFFGAGGSGDFDHIASLYDNEPDQLGQVEVASTNVDAYQWGKRQFKPGRSGGRALALAVLGVGLIWFVNSWRYGNLPGSLQVLVDSKVAEWVAVDHELEVERVASLKETAELRDNPSTKRLPTLDEIDQSTSKLMTKRLTKMGSKTTDNLSGNEEEEGKEAEENRVKPRLPDQGGGNKKLAVGKTPLFQKPVSKPKPIRKISGQDPRDRRIVPPPPPPPRVQGTNKVARDVRVREHYQKGNRYLSANKPALAIGQFRAAIALAPEFGMAFRSLAIASIVVGNNQDAAKAYTRFIELEPTHRDVHKIRAFLERYEGK